jgi:hypothetical protein
LAPRYVHGIGKRTLFVLIGFADVQNREMVKVRRNFVRGYLTDLSLGGV